MPPEASFIKYMEPSFCDKKEAEAEKESIRILLNRYEFIALGIRTGAFEEEIYKRLKSTFQTTFCFQVAAWRFFMPSKNSS